MFEKFHRSAGTKQSGAGFDSVGDTVQPSVHRRFIVNQVPRLAKRCQGVLNIEWRVFDLGQPEGAFAQKYFAVLLRPGQMGQNSNRLGCPVEQSGSRRNSLPGFSCGPFTRAACHSGSLPAIANARLAARSIVARKTHCHIEIPSKAGILDQRGDFINVARRIGPGLEGLMVF
jgi:hypothetical protein